jgi:hypothetical protein
VTGLLRGAAAYPNVVWVVGLNDTVLAGSPRGEILPVTLPIVGHDYVAAWTDESTAWLFASDGTTLRGLSFTDIEQGPTLFPVLAAAALNRRAIWVVGTNGRTAFYNGIQWQTTPSGTGGNLNGIAGDPALGFIAVGDGGVILFNPMVPPLLPDGLPDAAVRDYGLADMTGVPPSDLGYGNWCSIGEVFNGNDAGGTADCTITERCGIDTWQLACPTDTAQPCTCSYNGSVIGSGMLASRCVDIPTDTYMLRALCNAP